MKNSVCRLMISCLFLLLSNPVIKAQDFINFSAGYGPSTFILNSIDNNMMASKGNFYSIGGTFEHYLNETALGIKGGLAFKSIGVISSSEYGMQNVSLNYLHLPLQLTYKLNLIDKRSFHRNKLQLIIGAGVYFGMGLNGEVEGELGEDMPFGSSNPFAQGKANALDSGLMGEIGLRYQAFYKGFLSLSTRVFYGSSDVVNAPEIEAKNFNGGIYFGYTHPLNFYRY